MRQRSILILVGLTGLVAAGAALSLSAARPMPTVELVGVEGEGARYWPRWRGPSGQGHVAGTNYVDRWSSTENVLWRASVPGVGHSSPIVWDDHIFLTTSSEDGRRMWMLAFSRTDGRQRWQTEVPTDGSIEHVYWKNTRASATPTTDGTLVWASFGTHGLAAFDFDGNLVWQAHPGHLNNYHGSAGSPVLYGDRIFLYQDHRGTADVGSFVAAFDARTGEMVWQTPRRARVGWGTPIVIRVDDRDELVVSSQRTVQAYDPATGAELWTVQGMTAEVIPTPVVGHDLLFASSGRAGPTLAIRPGGEGDVTDSHVAWSSPAGSPFVPSALVHGDLLYLINDMQSILTVMEATTGERVYQGRLGTPVREGISSSPVVVGDRIFVTNDMGQTYVVRTGREFELLHVNELDAQVIASPALVDGIWYWRTDSELIAIGTPRQAADGADDGGADDGADDGAPDLQVRR